MMIDDIIIHSSNMLHHRAVYDSIEPHEATSLVPGSAEETFSHARARSQNYSLTKRTILLASLFLIGVVTLFVSDPSLTFQLPLIGQSIHKRHAQNLADDFRLTFLTMEPARELKHHRKTKSSEFKAPEGCEATVVIVRHCEKGSIREHCSYVGYERSVYLSTIFGDGDERWPAPSYIYALDASHRHNRKKRVYREMETVLPLAVKSNVSVDYSYDTHSVGMLARNVSDILRSGEACGKVIVICWKHSEIPHLAHRLGCGPGQGCPADYPSFTFDQAWEIKFVYHKMNHSERKNGKIPKHDVWNIYGNVMDEGFDPLAFSKKMGDYPKGGKPSAGSQWMPMDVEIPEQGLPKDIEHGGETAQ